MIVVGIRHDLLSGIDSTNLGQLMTPWSRKSNVEDVLDGMPKLRSGLSRNDSPAVWKQTMKDAAAAVCKAVAFWPAPERSLFRARVNESRSIRRIRQELGLARRLGLPKLGPNAPTTLPVGFWTHASEFYPTTKQDPTCLRISLDTFLHLFMPNCLVSPPRHATSLKRSPLITEAGTPAALQTDSGCNSKGNPPPPSQAIYQRTVIILSIRTRNSADR